MIPNSKTYREAIQELIEQQQQLYDKAGYLRDCADLEEKKYWNQFRTNTRNAADPLKQLDNSITDERGADKI